MNCKEMTQSDSDKRSAKKIILWIVLAIIALAVVAGAWFAWRYVLDYKVKNFESECVLYVYPDMSSEQVLDSLSVGASVKHPKSLYRTARKADLSQRMKPGKYTIGPEFTTVYAINTLCMGWQTPQNLTLSGTIRSKQRLAQLIGSQMMIDSLTVDSLLRDDEFLAQYGFDSEHVFAMFLPDTYEMYWTTTGPEIFERFKKEYDKFWTTERLEKAENQKLTQMEVSILASIVRGESLQEFEYPIIARVYLNRLHSGMKLQADPTIAYCFDYQLDRILTAHTKVDSPYNTYKYKGLPPGPINVPPKTCIDAVLNPDNNKYIYFCASPDFNGTHRFATSYSEHLKNAREFHRALTARRAAAAQNK